MMDLQDTSGTQSPPHDPAEAGKATVPFDRHMLEALVCPVTRGPLRYDAKTHELVSNAAHLAFPIRAGIPIMLVSEARDVG